MQQSRGTKRNKEGEKKKEREGGVGRIYTCMKPLK